MDVSFLSLSLSHATTSHRRHNTNRCINLAFPRRAIVAVPRFICSIQSYSRFSLRPDVLYFLLRYRLTPVIYISVIIGKVFHPELDENLFPSEVRLPPSFPPFPFSLSFSRSLSLFPFLILAIDFASFVKLLYCKLCVIVVLILRLIRAA